MWYQIDCEKETCLQYELKQEGNALPCSASAGTSTWVDKFHTALHMPSNRESAPSMSLEVTNKLQQAGELADTESNTNKDQVYVMKQI